MKPDDLELLAGIAPEDGRASGLFTTPEREDLFAAVTAQHREGRPGPARLPARTWAYRLVPVAAIGTAAAVAVVASGGAGASGGAPAAARHSHAAARPHQAAAPHVRTVGYVTRRTAAALASQDHGTLRMTTTYRSTGPDWMIQDLSSGASRYKSFTRDGAIAEDDSFTSDVGGTATIVDYSVRAWWTFRHEGGGDIINVTGPSLRQQLTAGVLALAGDDTVDGQHAIHLRYTAQMFTFRGKGYGVDTSDIWVNATSFLPIRERGTHGAWIARLSWSPRPPTHAQLTAVPPAGFTHTDGPPSSRSATPGGLG